MQGVKEQVGRPQIRRITPNVEEVRGGATYWGGGGGEGEGEERQREIGTQKKVGCHTRRGKN